VINDNENNNKNKQIIEFLQKEYDNLTQLITENEQLGERRIQFFLSLVGVVTTLIGIFGISELNFDFKKDENKQKFQIIIIIFTIVIMILIPFGIMTLKRLINRNIITDRRILDLEYIRNYFKKYASTELKKYFPFQEYDFNRCRTLEWKEIFLTKGGGLIETVALINSIIGGLISGAIVFFVILQTSKNILDNSIIYYIIFIFIVTCIVIWILQFCYVKNEYAKECTNRKKELKKREQCANNVT
jgi:hypothetical protein